MVENKKTAPKAPATKGNRICKKPGVTKVKLFAYPDSPDASYMVWKNR